MKTMDKKCLEIINNYGPKHQQKKLAEEQFELQEAITIVEQREQDYISDYESDLLIDEIADNIVLLGEFIQYYNLDIDKINNRIETKLDRQLDRIKKEGKNNEGIYPRGPLERV